jgi:hypothetical protein
VTAPARRGGEICLLPPTLLMGATLPAMSRWVESTPHGVSWLGFFWRQHGGRGRDVCWLASLLRVIAFDIRRGCPERRRRGIVRDRGRRCSRVPRRVRRPS